MKRKLYLFGAFVLLGLSSSYAQKNVKITWGPEFELPKKHYEIGFVGDNKKGYVEVSHQRGKSIALQKFTPSLKLSGQNELPTSGLTKGYMIESIWDMNNKDYLFYSTWNKSDKTEHLYAQELNVEKGQFQGTAKELLSSGDKLTGTLVMTGLYQFNTAGKWNLVRSADSSKLMVHYRIKPKEKKDAYSKDIIGVYVFDKNLNKVWGDQLEMPYTEKMMDNDDYQVDRNGNVYILAKVYNSEAKKKDKDDYHYEVLMYSKGSKKPNISSFSFGDKYVVDIALDEDQTGRMICTGFYSKSHKGTDGAFFMAFDEATKKMQNIKKGFYEFPTEVIKQFESKKAQKKMEKKEEKGEDEEVSHLVYRNLNLESDGSITLYGEQYYMFVTVSYNGKTTTTTYHYFYQDIYVTKIGPDGELKWVKKIPKEQHGTNTTMGLGFHLHTVGPDSYLFFVDNIKNLDVNKQDAPATHVAGAGGVLMCVKVAGDGTVSKSSIFDFREEKMNVDIKKFSDVTDHIIIGRARKLHGPFQMNFSEGKPLMITVD